MEDSLYLLLIRVCLILSTFSLVRVDATALKSVYGKTEILPTVNCLQNPVWYYLLSKYLSKAGKFKSINEGIKCVINLEWWSIGVLDNILTIELHCLVSFRFTAISKGVCSSRLVRNGIT